MIAVGAERSSPQPGEVRVNGKRLRKSWDRVIRALALSGALGPALFATAVIVCGALRPQYSHVTQFISELGAAGGPYSHLMNYGGFVPTGLLLVAFSTSTFYSFSRDGFSVLGAILVSIFGTGVMAAGICSCDSGYPTGTISVSCQPHNVVSLIAFAGGIFGPLMWGFHFRSVNSWRSFSIYSVLSSLAALVFLFVTAASVGSHGLTGVWQRVFIGILLQWCAVVGVRIYRAEARPAEPAG